jgi:ribosomal protein S18 acetylase RimI-like enzyme
MEKLTIHTGACVDIERLIELIDQLGYKTDRETLQRNLSLYADSIFIAEIEDEVVGFLAYHILPQFHSEHSHMRIVSLVVDKKHRGKGIGKRLLQEAEKIAHAKGCEVIELTSASHRIKSGAHAFYSGLGFKADGEKVYFRKKLDL